MGGNQGACARSQAQRKEAKVIARQAKKEAKQAKAELAEARSALAEAEAKLATPVVPVAKARKGRPVTSASSAGSDPVAQVTPALEPDNAASIASPQAGSVVEPPLKQHRPAFLEIGVRFFATFNSLLNDFETKIATQRTRRSRLLTILLPAA